MSEIRDWRWAREEWVRLLEGSTGESLDIWNARVQAQDLPDEPGLRQWLTQQGVLGYAQTLLVMERFGYPDYLAASAADLVDAQYADRPHLRPVFDALLAAAQALGPVTVQARKTYVSLLTPRRTFARIQPTTKDRLDLGLRLEGVQPGGRLQPSRIQETMRVQIGLSTLDDLDDEALAWLRRAYDENL